MLKGQRLSGQSRGMLEPFFTSLHFLGTCISYYSFLFQNASFWDKYIHIYCLVVKKLPFDFYGRRKDIIYMYTLENHCVLTAQ